MQGGQAVNTLSALLGSDTWSNAVCCGYVLLACKNLGTPSKKVETFSKP